MRTKFTGDVELWTEGNKIRVSLSGSTLRGPVKLSTHASTDPGQALLREIIVDRLSGVQLNSQLTSASPTKLLLESSDYGVWIEDLGNYVAINLTSETEQLTAQNVRDVGVDVRRVLATMGWKDKRTHIGSAELQLPLGIMLAGGTMWDSGRFGVLGMTSPVRLLIRDQVNLLVGARGDEELVEALDVLNALPSAARPDLIIDARGMILDQSLLALANGDRVLTGDSQAVQLEGLELTISAQLRRIEASAPTKTRLGQTKVRHVDVHSVMVTKDGMSANAIPAQSKLLIDALNEANQSTEIRTYRLGVADSKDPVINLLRQAGVPDPEALAAQIDAVRALDSEPKLSAESWHWNRTLG